MLFFALSLCFAHPIDPFRQLEEHLPTPNLLRTASGRAGPDYWQQEANYEIHVQLDEYANTLTGQEIITYTNHSPHPLPYLWVQLDQNYLSAQSGRELIMSAPHMNTLSEGNLRRLITRETYNGKMVIERVAHTDGSPFEYSIVDTMMRIDLTEPLGSGSSIEFSIDWHYTINNARAIWARTGFEYFEEDGNKIYEIAQFYPRMAAFTDVHGWHHRQYLGRGEFTLEFGDFELFVTVPKDHVLGATGILQNPEEVLTAAQQRRLEKSKTSSKPVYIVTPNEAQTNELHKSQRTATWHFKADNVRDVAFATSRKFIWDSMGVKVNDNTVLAQSFYPNEAEPLWSTYSTHAVAHTLKVYSDFVYPYPYPSAISVNGPIGGMEYPMICFNGPRPLEDKTYAGTTENGQPWRHSKYGLISVIIHEVGHNWFPMIINSDERSWAWMDEGLNTFVQYIAESTFETDYPSRRGEPRTMARYMQSDNRVPIMTDSEAIPQYGNNAYALPAAALTLLRESVMGPELFDFAFQEYSHEWAFKRPMPADFFRVMEEASGMDLDWFWNGWFYSTSHVDIALRNVTHYTPAPKDPTLGSTLKKAKRAEEPKSPLQERAKDLEKYIADFPELIDFYTDYDALDVTEDDLNKFDEFMAEASVEDKQMLNWDQPYIRIELENLGGLVSPVPVTLVYDNGTTETIRLPVDIWRKNPLQFSKLIPLSATLDHVIIDQKWETGDVDRSNNRFPKSIENETYEVEFSTDPPENPMQKARKDPKEASE
ncbi:MAG: M1 family metallopeptidase [Myxococcota bacterium]